MKKLTKEQKPFERKPINAYYQFKDTGTKHAKVKVLKKGQTFTGTFEHTFVSEEGYVSHLIDTKEEGQITIKGCTILNNALKQLSRGNPVEITFLGRGKANKGKQAPWMFDVAGEPSEKSASAPRSKPPIDEPDLSSAEEDLDDEVAF